MENFSIFDWRQKHLLNESANNLKEERSGCDIIEENFWEFVKDNAEYLADIFKVADYYEKREDYNNLDRLEKETEAHPNWQEFLEYLNQYYECVGKYVANKRIKAFLKPYIEKSDILSLMEGENMDLSSLVKNIFGKLEEGDVEELQNPLKQMGKDFKVVTDAIKAIKYYIANATPEEKQMIKDEIMAQLFGKAKHRR